MALFGDSSETDALIAQGWQAYFREQARQQAEAQAQQDFYAQQAEQKRQAAIAGQTTTAQAFAPTPAPTPSGPPPLPAGFETSYAPSSLVTPYVEQAYTGARSTADEFLNNMLKRGTVTQTGYNTGQAALDTQAPSVKQKFQDLGNLLISQEQAGLRGIGSQGEEAAQKNVADFTAGLPAAYAGQVSSQSPAIGFDVSGLGGAVGAVSGPQDISLDPYASNIGSATKGDETQPDTSATKRRVSVF
jgi:hypothetical protein